MADNPKPVHNRIEVVTGDITKLDVDAIVNAANKQLSRGGGVSGAIHRAAGAELEKEAVAKGPVETGEARITKGYSLPAGHVIHTVGPVWHGGEEGEPRLLTAAYKNSLALAAENDLKTIAFPAISTGVFGYPLEAATTVAVETVAEYLKAHDRPEKVIFCCFSETDASVYEKALAALG